MSPCLCCWGWGCHGQTFYQQRQHVFYQQHRQHRIIPSLSIVYVLLGFLYQCSSIIINNPNTSSINTIVNTPYPLSTPLPTHHILPPRYCPRWWRLECWWLRLTWWCVLLLMITSLQQGLVVVVADPQSSWSWILFTSAAGCLSQSCLLVCISPLQWSMIRALLVVTIVDSHSGSGGREWRWCCHLYFYCRRCGEWKTWHAAATAL